jgi:hypothetical protein
MKSLAEAFRDRAKFLSEHNARESPWGDNQSVVSALYEMADVVDSWSGEYLSKEETHKENQRRRWGSIDPQPPMTMEDRIKAVKKPNKVLDLGE